MIKALVITENEKQRILNLHNYRLNNSLISEQWFSVNGVPYYQTGPQRLPDGAVPITQKEYNRLLLNQQKELLKSRGSTSKKDFSYDYIKFGPMGEIPVLKGTKLYYLEDSSPDVGEILGITKKDQFGYYDEIDIESWGTKVKRYYPKNDWEDWAYLRDNKIPFAFTTPASDNSRQFHLALVLTDPTQSVINLDDENNKNRGWQLSSPGFQSNLQGDSKTGYFQTVNGVEVPYNITAPIIRGDMSTFDLDKRSSMIKFLDSGWGLAAQIGLSIAITVICREPIAIALPISEGALTTNAMLTRMVLATMITEAIVNVPIAFLYFKEEGDEYDTMGWISILFCFLPLVQSKLLKGVLQDFSEATCISLARKIVQNRMTRMTLQEIQIYTQKLTLAERTLFYDVLINAPQLMAKSPEIEALIKSQLKQYEEEFAKNTAYQNALVSLYQAELRQTGFVKSLLVDFSSTLIFAKASGTILEKYYTYKHNKGQDIENEPFETQEKYKENIKKIDQQIQGFPQMIKNSLKTKEWETHPWALTDADYKYMVEKGILSDKFIREAMMFPLREFKDCKDLDYVNEEGMDKLVTFATEVLNSEQIKKLSNNDRKLWELWNKCLTERVEKKTEVTPPLTSSTETTSITSSTETTEFEWKEVDEMGLLKMIKDPNYETKSEPNMVNNVQMGYKYFIRKKPQVQQEPQQVDQTQPNQNTQKQSTPSG